MKVNSKFSPAFLFLNMIIPRFSLLLFFAGEHSAAFPSSFNPLKVENFAIKALTGVRERVSKSFSFCVPWQKGGGRAGGEGSRQPLAGTFVPFETTVKKHLCKSVFHLTAKVAFRADPEKKKITTGYGMLFK